MMSSFETSSPVSASTFTYLMRWPVFRLIWLKLIFSESDVAGYKATGQVTSERRKKPFQLARGAIEILQNATEPGFKTIVSRWFRQTTAGFLQIAGAPSGLPKCALFVLISAHKGAHMNIDHIRSEIEHMRRQILRQRKEIQDLQRAGVRPNPPKSC